MDNGKAERSNFEERKKQAGRILEEVKTESNKNLWTTLMSVVDPFGIRNELENRRDVVLSGEEFEKGFFRLRSLAGEIQRRLPLKERFTEVQIEEELPEITEKQLAVMIEVIARSDMPIIRRTPSEIMSSIVKKF